jgi:hypothetical protein
MRRFWCLAYLLAACSFLANVGNAQSRTCTSVGTGVGVTVGGCSTGAGQAGSRSGLPRNIRLPNGDFVWHWGTRPVDDDPDAHDFSIDGSEQPFFCHLTGSFHSKFPRGVADPSGSVRELLDRLSISERFVVDATEEMNRIFRDGSETSWAMLSCKVVEVSPTDEALQERADKARERAERQRERRRDE